MDNNPLTNDEGVLRHADIVSQVFELHRKSHHYNLEKARPGLKETLTRKLDHIKREFVEEAFEIYKQAGERLPKRPHPNYLYAVAKRLSSDNLDKRLENRYNYNSKLGKNI